jgi:hypothetical protein
MWRLAFVALTACNFFESEPEQETRPLATQSRVECEAQATDLGFECATVYLFQMAADNPLGQIEKCVPARYLDEAVTRYGGARVSDDSRFDVYAGDPPCVWSCPEAVDCNAWDGCDCPELPPLP